MNSDFEKYCVFTFCDQIFHGWKERINHIGAHLQDPWGMSEWRDKNEEEKDTDATDASEDESGDSEFDELNDERDSNDTEDGPPGLGPSNSSHDQGDDRLGGHPSSSAKRPGSNSHHSRYRDGTSTGLSIYDCMTYGCQADPSVSAIST